MEQTGTPSGSQELKKGSVFVISGGTAGIVSPVAMDLVRSTKGKFFCLVRTHFRAKSDGLLGKLKTDREGLKKDLAKMLTGFRQESHTGCY